MSFDTEFIYGNISGYISDCGSMASTEISTLANNLAIAANISNTYVDVKQSYIDTMTLRKNVWENKANAYVIIQDELTLVGNLASDDKNVLYDFYTTHYTNYSTKRDFMARLMFNTTGMISAAGNIMINDPPSAETANLVTELVAESHHISRYAKCVCLRLNDNGDYVPPYSN